MIYEYKELKGIIKVGDKVRAVPGKHNPCVELKDDGSNEEEITDVCKDGFSIAFCKHFHTEHEWLEIVNKESTWDNLQVGDVIEGEYGDNAKVLAVIGDVFLRSGWNSMNTAYYWVTKKEAQRNGWKLQQPIQVKEVSLEEVAEKFGVPVEKIKI